MSEKALYTIEQVDGKLMITVELVKPESPVNTEWPRIDEVDLSKYKPFPRGYKVPKGIKVVAVIDDRGTNHEDYSKGKIGITVDSCNLPYVDFNEETYTAMRSYELAPLDPSDHPDYKAEEPESRPMNAEEIVAWLFDAEKMFPTPTELVDKINALVQYELNKAKR